MEQIKNFYNDIHHYFIHFVFLLTICFVENACALNTDIQAQLYIDQYKKIAVEEMHQVGVPASIKLAQAMLESDYGQSRLATEGRNHFGIKCKSYWQGMKIYADDDAPQECFRKYATVQDSYMDHSNFLRNHHQNRYDHLFNLSRTDYVSWAKGLKKAGYATNPQYAELLIDIIIKYQLYRFDTMRPEDFNPPAYVINQPPPSRPPEYTIVNSQPIVRPKPLPPSPPPVRETIAGISQAPQPKVKTIPVPNASTEKTQRVGSSPWDESGEPLRIRKGIINNRFIIVANLPLQASYISNVYDMPLELVYKYNDLENGHFPANTPIYLQKKKNKAAKGKNIHTVKEGQSIEYIAQLYGVRLKKILKRNYMLKGQQPASGQKIYLNKKRRKVLHLAKG